MYSLKATIKALSFIGAIVLAAATSQAVSPPPDGGYPNQNTAEGDDALFSLTSGNDNTALGFNALYGNTVGLYNTAVGSQALFALSIGGENTAVGFQALYNSKKSFDNTAIGFEALYNDKTGWDNTAIGSIALLNNVVGTANTAIGYNALSANTEGGNNIAVGMGAGKNLTFGDYNIDIGNNGVAGEAQTIRIGNIQTSTYIAGIYQSTVPAGIPVIVDSKGHLGTTTSSARFKDGIKPMDKSSEAILALKPVTFHYKHDLDPDGIPQFGLVAEQVEKVDPDLVACDDQGEPYTVRYEAVNAMLLNEFLKAHQKIEALTRKDEGQEATNRELKSAIAQQQKQIQALTEAMKAQAAQIQKVNDQLKTQVTPRVVVNN